jgi:hypothetical protein
LKADLKSLKHRGEEIKIDRRSKRRRLMIQLNRRLKIKSNHMEEQIEPKQKNKMLQRLHSVMARGSKTQFKRNLRRHMDEERAK